MDNLYEHQQIEQKPIIYSKDNSNNGNNFSNFFPSGRKFISFLIGVFILVIILVLFYKFIIPSLSSNKENGVVLTYWGIGKDEAVINSVILDFQKEYPNIKIIYQKQDIKTLGRYIDRIRTRISNENVPDIFRFHNSWLIEIGDLLAPVPSSFTTDLDTSYYNVIQRDLKINGTYYGIPLEIDTLSLFVNDELLKSSGINGYPSTWDDLSKIAKSITIKEEDGKIKTSGVAMGTYDNIAHASDILSLLFLQNGADLKSLNGPTHKNAEDALFFYTSFAKDNNAVWDDNLENSRLAFAKGKLAMFFGYSEDVIEIKKLNPSLQFSIIPVPHLPGRNLTIASYWVEGVSSKSKHPKEAFEFLKYLSRKEVLSKLYSEEVKSGKLFGEPYAKQDMADLLRDNVYIYPFVQQAKDSASTIFSSDTYDDALSSELNAYIGNSIRSSVNGTSVEDSINTLASGVNQVLVKYSRIN